MVVFITGAGSGVGLAAAQHFAKAGVPTAMFDVVDEKVQAAAATVEVSGAACVAYPLDVADPARVDTAFSQASHEIGSPTILINAAGVGARGSALDLPLEDWQRVMNINVTGSYLCARAAARRMIERKSGGRIINFASSLALRAGAGRVAYGTSKTAVIGLTRQLAVEWSPHAITVNAIAPGWIETPMTAKLSAELRDTYQKSTPATRLGEVTDIVAAIEYIASPGAGFFTGQVLVVDGGFTIYGLPDS